MPSESEYPKISMAYFAQLESTQLPIVPLLGIELTHIGAGWAQGCVEFNANHLRPGGTVSGPIMMALADYVAFAAVLSSIGPKELAVTSNLNINFLSKPAPSDLIGRAQVLRVGRRFAYTDVKLFSVKNGKEAQPGCANALTGDVFADVASETRLVAQSSVIYAIPD